MAAAEGRKVISITDDGFPLESLPPQGKITIHYDDGTTESFTGTPQDKWDLEEKYGLPHSTDRVGGDFQLVDQRETKKTTMQAAGRTVVSITDDGFPMKSMPPKGTITIHYDDGSTESIIGTPQDKWDLEEKYGLPHGSSEDAGFVCPACGRG
ncbi:hypothetical protein QOT17_022546 [Balamuthia mandrillaris]